MASKRKTLFPIQDYDLNATLASGQVFRWNRSGEAWTGVVGGRWVKLRHDLNSISAETAAGVDDWKWLEDFLQIEVNLTNTLATFPDDEPMQHAVAACHGLRLLRQEPWECLASFILSSTKQILQIRQIVALLCERFGDQLVVPPGSAAAFSFPSAVRLATASEAELRNCKMGFRAPYLLATARLIAAGKINLEAVGSLPASTARSELMQLPGVGGKVADCVLLFAYGFPTAFPIDVWVMRALQQLYFSRRQASPRSLQAFAATHFGQQAGYAQQYLFHYMRTRPAVSPENHENARSPVRSR
jgi:N-glycosylase/DNA lyase